MKDTATTDHSPVAELRRRLAKAAEEEKARADRKQWQPDSGDVLDGTVVEVYETAYNPSLVVATDSGQFIVRTSPKGLRGKLVDLDVQPGDRLAIQFIGEHDTGKANPAKTYAVVCDPGTRPEGVDRFDWAQHAPEGGRKPTQQARSGAVDSWATPPDPEPPEETAGEFDPDSEEPVRRKREHVTDLLLAEYLDQFVRRIVLNAINEADATYWLRRACELEAGMSRPDDYAGNATREELAARNRRLREVACACRNRAAVAAHGEVA